jgi:hypothetical protein
VACQHIHPHGCENQEDFECSGDNYCCALVVECFWSFGFFVKHSYRKIATHKKISHVITFLSHNFSYHCGHT